jgi:hypothetical protein
LEIGVLRIDRRDATQEAILRARMNDFVLVGFAARILPVDQAVAQRSTQLHVPNPGPLRDALIAETALVQA